MCRVHVYYFLWLAFVRACVRAFPHLSIISGYHARPCARACRAVAALTCTPTALRRVHACACSATVATALALFTTSLANASAPVPPNLRSAVFASVVRHNGMYTTMRDIYMVAVEPGLRLSALSALAASFDPAELASTLEFAISGDVRAQDAVSLVVAVGSNPIGRSLAWAFVKANWAVFDARYGAGGFAISALVEGVTAGLSTAAAQADVEVRVYGCVCVWVGREREKGSVCVCLCVCVCVRVTPLAALQAFWAYHPAPAASREIAMALEAIGGNVQWAATSLAPTCGWLATQ